MYAIYIYQSERVLRAPHTKKWNKSDVWHMLFLFIHKTTHNHKVKHCSIVKKLFLLLFKLKYWRKTSGNTLRIVRYAWEIATLYAKPSTQWSYTWLFKQSWNQNECHRADINDQWYFRHRFAERQTGNHYHIPGIHCPGKFSKPFSVPIPDDQKSHSKTSV